MIQSSPVDESSQDVISWAANPPLQKGDEYQVRAEVANPDVEELTAAGTDYPQWVKDHYLQIPDDVRPKIQSLAESLTTGLATPYDKANAITSYLRTTIQYSTSVTQPPRGQDPVLWVLLNSKQGFCNYYASAEVLMLRSLGIPARLAVGYAQGQYDTGAQAYIVRNRDAHAWPEVYFPNLGWVEFEPTANQSPLSRPTSSTPAPGEQDGPLRGPVRSPVGRLPENGGLQGLSSASTAPFLRTPLGRTVLFSLSLIAILLLAWIANRYRFFIRLPLYLSRSLERNGIKTPRWIENWVRWNQSSSVERAFTSINLSLWWLGHPQPLHATPAERASTLAGLLPTAASSVEVLTSELETALYSRQAANLARARRAGTLILLHTLRFHLQRAWDGIQGAYHETR